MWDCRCDTRKNDVSSDNLDAILEKGGSLVAVESLIACSHDPLIAALAVRRGRTPQQILLRWTLQLGVPVLFQSANQSHVTSNMDVFGFSLNQAEMLALEGNALMYGSDCNGAHGAYLADPFNLRITWEDCAKLLRAANHLVPWDLSTSTLS